MTRVALGVGYNGQAYSGWQSQLSGNTIQDKLEAALGRFATHPVSTLCAGRTDAGVHGLMQVVHFDTPLQRPASSWVRGTNTFLPADIAVQWAQPVPSDFHARASAVARRYAYVLLQSPVRPSVDAGRVGWVFHPLDHDAMRQAADILLYKATEVPTGEDQKQHLELTRDIAIKFNNDFSQPDFFPITEPVIAGPATRVMSLKDASKKMSKSDPAEGARILLMDDADAIAKKIKRATTDPEPLPLEEKGLEGRLEANNLVGIYAALSETSKAAVLTQFG
eukprot:gene46099-61639_t